MGYDMYVKNPAREQPPWPDWTTDPDDVRNKKMDAIAEWEAEGWYLRRSIGGQPSLREALLQVGAAFDNYEFDSSWAVIVGGSPHVEGVPSEGVLLEYHPTDREGIPIHKLCDNSGWLVTELECQQALAKIQEYAMTNPDEGLPQGLTAHNDVLPFLRLAAKHGGFEVW